MIKLRNPINKAHVWYFPTVNDYLEEISIKTLGTESPAVRMDIKRGAMKADWWGGGTYEENWELCRTGMNVDRESFAISEQLLTKVRLAKHELSHWDVCGSAVDVGAFNSGVPECMLNFDEREGRCRKTVSLLLAIGCHSGISARSMRIRGAAYMALLDALEMSRQYRLNVFAVSGAGEHSWGDHGNLFHTVIKVKSAGSFYDPHALGFIFGHPAMFRRLNFGLLDRASTELKISVASSDNYGYPKPVETLPDSIDVGCVDLTKNMDEHFYNEEQAQEWLLKQLETFNIVDKAGLL